MADPFLGEIKIFGGTYAILGWSFCDGSLLSISQNDALFSLFGTTYGGDGQNSFGLPDLRGRVPIHVSPSYPQGQVAGVENVALFVGNLPAHRHPIATTTTATNNNPAGLVLANSGKPQYTPSASASETMAPNEIQQTGVSAAHNNVMPFLVLNFIVALQGIYPSRN